MEVTSKHCIILNQSKINIGKQRNYSITHVLQEKTKFVNNLRTFGCIVYVRVVYGIETILEPTTYEKAIQDKEQELSIQSKVKYLKKNDA